MESTITLIKKIRQAERPCQGDLTWAETKPGTKRARDQEKLCAQCPALPDCQQLASQLERWRLQGTIGGNTYSRVAEPKVCARCGGEFHTRRTDRKFCSAVCSAENRWANE